MRRADPIVIVDSVRTPIGAFQGALSQKTAVSLGATVIRAVYERFGGNPGDISEVLMGCVLTAGLGQAPARQAAIQGLIPDSVPCTTISKVCGSGMKAVTTAHDVIACGSADLIIAGGMESMTNAPYLLDRARNGYRLGHGRTIDHIFLDGLEDAYERGRLMGSFGDEIAREFQFTRHAQDAFALRSLMRARRASDEGLFFREICAVEVKNGPKILRDETPDRASPEKIHQLLPAFSVDGTVTAANAASISDGAAALLLMRQSEASRRGLPVQAVIRAHASQAQKPSTFATAPAAAIRTVVGKAGWSVDEVDLFEVNEAFALVVMITQQLLDIPDDKINVHGGACALGHPIGASGARIIVTLLAALETKMLNKGVASLCIGGGEALAIAIERVNS